MNSRQVLVERELVNWKDVVFQVNNSLLRQKQEKKNILKNVHMENKRGEQLEVLQHKCMVTGVAKDYNIGTAEN